MGETLADLFDSANGRPICWHGRTLIPKYSVPVDSGDAFRMRFLGSVPSPVQGMGLHAENCSIRVASVVAKDIALWRDTAPDVVEFSIVRVKKGARVILTNQWRDEKYGSTMYRLNNAAIEVVPQDDGSVILRCSDGWGEPDFESLVVQLWKDSATLPGAPPE
jgi:hypothetical protein